MVGVKCNKEFKFQRLYEYSTMGSIQHLEGFFRSVIIQW